MFNLFEMLRYLPPSLNGSIIEPELSADPSTTDILSNAMSRLCNICNQERCPPTVRQLAGNMIFLCTDLRGVPSTRSTVWLIWFEFILNVCPYLIAMDTVVAVDELNVFLQLMILESGADTENVLIICY